MRASPRPQADAPKATPPEAEALRRALEKAETQSISIDAAGALQSVAEALRLARRLGDDAAAARAHAIAAAGHYYRGDYVAAVANGIDAFALGGATDARTGAMAMLGIALSFAFVGELRRGEEAARRALRLAAAAQDRRMEAQAQLILGCILSEAGRFEESLASLRRARSAFRRQGDGERASATAVNIGHLLLRQAGALGDSAGAPEAARHRRRARRFYRAALDSGRPRLGAVMVQTALADCELGLGNVAGALALLEQSRRVLEPHDPARIVARLDYYLGEAHRRMGHAAEAARHLHRALEAADAIDGDDLAVQCREALSRLAEDLGDEAGARRWDRDARSVLDRRRASLADFRRQMRPLWDRFLRQEPG
jgi:tetratricopeptide (TPR) repeat protein